jgi:acyl-coenzyme A thioesterase PaaI-like protein
MDRAGVEAWFRAHRPRFDKTFSIESLAPRRARMRLFAGQRYGRPGGTPAGPTLMTLADAAVYAAILAGEAGATDAVTGSFHMCFLRRPPLRDVLADAEILKTGRTLIVGEVRLLTEGDDEPTAQATVSHARP